MGGIFKGLVKDLDGTFYYNNGQRPDLHTGVAVTHFSEQRIAPIFFHPLLAYLINLPAQVIAMFLLLFDKQAHSIHIIRVAQAESVTG